LVFAAMNVTGSFNDLAALEQRASAVVHHAADMPADWTNFPSQADDFASRGLGQP